VIEGGWICRACWKSNRPSDDRCYRCKTPRDQQLEVEAGSLKESSAPGFEKRGRLDVELPVLTTLVAWPMWLSGWLTIVAGALGAVLALLAAVAGNVAGGLVTFVSGLLIIALGSLVIFLSRSVRRNARWAYVIAAIVYLLSSVPALFVIGDVRRLAPGYPDWAFTVQTILSLIYLALGLLAILLLITSFMRRDSSESSAPPEAS
jgi:hypothetical protein